MPIPLAITDRIKKILITLCRVLMEIKVQNQVRMRAGREGADPTQKQLTDSLVEKLHYNQCDKAEDEDEDGDRRTCGGCIKVPDIQIGESTKRRK
ncbi:hypothetical protein BGX24_003817 [Mortierella sp. AD032]|nr:hypothetical protein BGX24_003817 [Mortierella sp. AD032]